MTCYHCGQHSTQLCDGLLLGTDDHKTCDRELCVRCAIVGGAGHVTIRGKGKKSINFRRDYCKECAEYRGRPAD